MSDQISLTVNKQELSRFTSYSVDADFYLAADAFQIETAGIISGLSAGQRVQLKVNGTVELDGILDAPRRTVEKSKLTMKLSGRDLAGVLVDSHCNGYGDIKNVTLKGLTEILIKTVPFIQRNNIFYQNPKDIPLLTWETVYVEPCRSVFDVLAEKAKACGLIFYAMPDGKFYFGKPKAKGDIKFHIVQRKDGAGNNCVFSDYVDDISKRYSKVSIISNGQGTDAKPPSELTTAASAYDKSFPFYKPFYAIESTGIMLPAQQARMIMDMQLSFR